MWIFVGIAIIIILVLAARGLSDGRSVGPSSSAAAPSTKIVYSKKPLLTMNERDFLRLLLPLEEYNLKIAFQVPLSAVVEKDKSAKHRTELFRVIDFVILDSSYNVLLLIELNDATHKEPKRRYRDHRVHDIAEQAGLPLMTFYTNKPNEQGYVLHRIAEALKQQKQNGQ